MNNGFKRYQAPVKLLHTEWSNGWGGQEVRILDECDAFIAKGYQVTVACRPAGCIRQVARQRGIPTVTFPFRFPYDVQTILRLFRYIRRNGISLVHTHSSVDSWAASIAARSAGVPVVRSRHLTAPISTSPLSRFLYMKLADLVITSGRTIRDAMIERNGYNPDRIIPIAAGVDEKRFRPGLDPSGVRAELKLSDRDYVIGMVAVLRSWKGHLDLLEAARLLLPEKPDLKLLMVGEGPYRKTIEERVRQLELQDRVVMTGYRDDVPELLSAMNQFILPSIKNEATSQVTPQAMLVGIPVIVSTAGGSTEVIDHGLTGRLIPPSNPRAIKEAVLANWRDPAKAEKMAEAAREKALAEFTFDQMIRRTEEVYHTLLG